MLAFFYGIFLFISIGTAQFAPISINLSSQASTKFNASRFLIDFKNDPSESLTSNVNILNSTDTDEFEIYTKNTRSWSLRFSDNNTFMQPNSNQQYNLNITVKTNSIQQIRFQIQEKQPYTFENTHQIIICKFISSPQQIQINNINYSQKTSIVKIVNNSVQFNIMNNYIVHSILNRSCITRVNYTIVFQGPTNNTIKVKKLEHKDSPSLMSPFKVYKLDFNNNSCSDLSTLNVDGKVIRSSFLFSNKTTTQFLPKSVHSAVLEYSDGIWPSIGSFVLPIKMNQQLQFFASYKLDKYQYLGGIELFAYFCFHVSLSNANNSEQDATIFDIFICPWTSFNESVLQNLKQKEKTVDQFNNPIYYLKSSYHYFIKNFNKSEVKKFQIMSYIHSLHIEKIYNMKIIKLEAKYFYVQGLGYLNMSDISFYTQNNGAKTNRTEKKQQLYSAIGQQAVKAIGGAVSVPNIGPLLKLTPFIALIDDFSYFVYHSQTSYDTGFDFVSELCWNWTHSKWEPPSIVLQALNMSLSSTEPGTNKWLTDKLRGTPLRFQYRTEDIFFINNCKGYLLYTLPFSAIMFLALWKIRWRYYENRNLAVILRSFSSWSFFVVNIISDNAQFLSFRGFSQLRFLVPNGFLGFVSLTIALFMIVTVVLCAISLYMLSWKWALGSFRSVLLKRNLPAFCMVSLWIGIKVAEGFVHATIDNSNIRILLLFWLQICVLASLVFCSYLRIQRYKCTYATLIAGYFFRSMLYGVLLLQIIFKDSLQLNNFTTIDSGLSSLTLWIIVLIFICNFVQIIGGITVGLFSNTSQQRPQSTSKKQEPATQTKESNRPLNTNKQKEIIKTQAIEPLFKKGLSIGQLTRRILQLHTEKEIPNKKEVLYKNTRKQTTKLDAVIPQSKSIGSLNKQILQIHPHQAGKTNKKETRIINTKKQTIKQDPFVVKSIGQLNKQIHQINPKTDVERLYKQQTTKIDKKKEILKSDAIFPQSKSIRQLNKQILEIKPKTEQAELPNKKQTKKIDVKKSTFKQDSVAPQSKSIRQLNKQILEIKPKTEQAELPNKKQTKKIDVKKSTFKQDSVAPQSKSIRQLNKQILEIKPKTEQAELPNKKQTKKIDVKKSTFKQDSVAPQSKSIRQLNKQILEIKPKTEQAELPNKKQTKKIDVKKSTFKQDSVAPQSKSIRQLNKQILEIKPKTEWAELPNKKQTKKIDVKKSTFKQDSVAPQSKSIRQLNKQILEIKPKTEWAELLNQKELIQFEAKSSLNVPQFKSIGQLNKQILEIKPKIEQVELPNKKEIKIIDSNKQTIKADDVTPKKKSFGQLNKQIVEIQQKTSKAGLPQQNQTIKIDVISSPNFPPFKSIGQLNKSISEIQNMICTKQNLS